MVVSICDIVRPLMTNVTRFGISRLSQYLSTELFDLCCKVFSAKNLVCLSQDTSCAIALSRKLSVLYTDYLLYIMYYISVILIFVLFFVTHRCTESGLGRIVFPFRERWLKKLLS